VRLGNNQRGVVGRDHHAIGEGDVIGHLSHDAVSADERDDSLAAVDVGVPATVHDDLVPGSARKTAQVGMIQITAMTRSV
jgi:hypothetical protein